MPADKKHERSTLPRPEKENVRNQEDHDQKIKNEKHKNRQKRVTYVVKDLPIY